MTTATASKIKIACDCGKKYLVKAHLIGRRGSCPSCKRELVIRRPKKDPDAKKSTSNFKKQIQKNKALNDRIKSGSSSSVGSTAIAISICVLVTIGAIAAGTQLRSDTKLVFMVLLAIGCMGSLVAARMMSVSEELLRVLVITIPSCYAFVAVLQVFSILLHPSARDNFTLLGWLVPLGPALIYAGSHLDKILEFIDPSEESGGKKTPAWRRPEVQFVGAACALIILFGGFYQLQLDGPQFVKFYIVLALICCFVMLIVRLAGAPIACFVLVVLAFEAVGVIRFGYGLTQGMQRFTILGQLMLFGPIGIMVIPFLDRILGAMGSGTGSGWDSGGYGGYVSSCSSCSSGGSSCGGGGCGGGGCGGCGG